MFRTFSNFEPSFLAAMHDGEKEGITILKAEADSGMVFCTGDMIAIESLGMLGLSDLCVSFEEVLQMSGLLKSVPRLLPSLTKKTCDVRLGKGKTRRLTGECFKNPPL
jgi:hypothetical protein